MAMYRYVKSSPRSHVRALPIVSLVCIIAGISLLSWVLLPIISFQLTSSDFFASTVTPLSDAGVPIAASLPRMVVAAGQDNPKPIQAGTDLNNPNMWFPGQTQKKVVTPVNTYTLTIPKLHIKNAIVRIAGDDLNEGLIHYGGTALPGEYGTTVIFGHSTLPQLFDPTNYHTIFSTLPTLKSTKGDKDGDEIFVTYDGATYRYMIFDMVVTKPEDLSSLEQRFDDSYMTLVTCVPPGTYWQRLNIKAKLVPLQ